MPVIVIGADSPLGEPVLEALRGREGEIRAFVSDPADAAGLRERGIKVALGDVSDASHVSGAAVGCFSAVLLSDAALDGRERSFARAPIDVVRGWAEALGEAGVQRGIWVGRGEIGQTAARLLCPRLPEVAFVSTAGRSARKVAAEVARADDAATL